MKILSRVLFASVSSAVSCTASEMKAREAFENPNGTTEPTAPPFHPPPQYTPFHPPPQYTPFHPPPQYTPFHPPPQYTPFHPPPQYTPFHPPPQYTPYPAHHGRSIYPNLGDIEEEASTAKHVQETASHQSQDPRMQESDRNTPLRTRAHRSRPAGSTQSTEDEDTASDEEWLSMRYGESLAPEDAVRHLLKHISSCQSTTDKKSNLYTVYDTHLEQVIPIVEKYFTHSEARLDLISHLRGACRKFGREYASPAENELFPPFLPCSRLLQKVKAMALLPAGTSDSWISRVIGYWSLKHSQERVSPSDESASRALQNAFDALDAIKKPLAESRLINTTEFLPFAEVSGMLVRILDCLRVGSAFRRPSAFKQALCSILKLNFFAARLQRLQNRLSKESSSRAEANRFRYNFFKAQFFETLKEFNFSCLTCLESISPEYISLNMRNTQHAYYAFSTLRCLNSMAKLMTTLLNLNSLSSSSLKAVERDLVFVASTLILYALHTQKDASIPKILSTDSSFLGNTLSRVLGTSIRSFDQALDGELRQEGAILGRLMPSDMAEHKIRMKELESVLEKKISAAFSYEKERRALQSLGRTRNGSGNDRKEFGLVDYLCELVLEVTGQNITYVKAANAVSSDGLDTLLSHALESPTHSEIRQVLFAGPVLGEIFKAIDDDYGSRVSTPFRRLSVEDESYKDLLERMRSTALMSISPDHLRLLMVRYSILEDRYLILGKAVLVAAVLASILSAFIYLYCMRSPASRKDPEHYSGEA